MPPQQPATVDVQQTISDASSLCQDLQVASRNKCVPLQTAESGILVQNDSPPLPPPKEKPKRGRKRKEKNEEVKETKKVRKTGKTEETDGVENFGAEKITVIEEKGKEVKREVKKTSLIRSIEEEIVNSQSVLLSLTSSLLQSLQADETYKNGKNQPVLNDLKTEIYVRSASILKHGQKQIKVLDKLKEKLLLSPYPVCPEIMDLSDDKYLPLSSKCIENGFRKQKKEEERMMFEKERESLSNFLFLFKKEENEEKKLIEPPNPSQKAKESLFEALVELSSHQFSGIKKRNYEDFERMMSDLKKSNQSEWLLTRLAKKRYDLFQLYKKKKMTQIEMEEAIDIHVIGELKEIPSCLKCLNQLKRLVERKLQPTFVNELSSLKEKEYCIGKQETENFISLFYFMKDNRFEKDIYLYLLHFFRMKRFIFRIMFMEEKNMMVFLVFFDLIVFLFFSLANIELLEYEHMKQIEHFLLPQA